MRFLFTLLLAVAAAGATAQKTGLDAFSNWKPRNIGPAGMSGRITSIDVVRHQPNTWYIGAASGGVWKTENAGATWKPIFDEQPLLNIGSLAIQQSNPNIVWAGTGEGNPRNSLNLGEGIYKTMDGGRTWKRMGLEKTRNIYRILIDPNNADVVYVAAIGNPYAEHPERGVYKTTDGGQTWSRILYTNESSGAAELVMDPHNPNRLLAAMWHHRRNPWSFRSGGPGSGLYLTEDGGRSWKKLGTEAGMPAGEIGRIGLAYAKSLPGRVYAKVEAKRNGLYQSDDAGLTWKLINSNPADVTDRPFYYQEIYVDPQNENRIYDIHSTVTYSEDAGRSFKTMLPYSGIHPDHHAWYIHPDNPDFILDGNDGGIGITRDRGRTWVFDEKIPVGQFYHVNVDNKIPYNVMGGMQDNGSWHGPAYSWTNGGIRNYYWKNVGGGDGFDVVPDPQNEDWIYSMSQGGNVGRLNTVTGERWFVKPPVLDTALKFRFNWNAAIAVDPLDPSTVYYGSQVLHRSRNKGASWETISPDLTTNVAEQQRQDENGGLTLDVTGAENFNTILAIAPSYKEAGTIWVGTDDGNVQLTRDGGKTWTSFRGRIPGMPTGAWIPQVRASRHNAGEAFVVANDYRRGDFKPYIFRTTDYGRTWTRLADERKVTGYALTVLQDPAEPNLIFAGTEQGLWVSLDNGASFAQWKHGYPSVSTYDLAIQEREADLAIATFGRALWVLDDIRPLRAAAAARGPLPALKAFPAPTAYLANFSAAPGYEWSTYGLYEGDNRNRGAALSYYIAQPDTGRGKDSLFVRIYNERNEAVRTLKWAADTGINRRYWGLEERGVRNPGAPRPRPGASEPGGLTVMPGTYKVVYEYQGRKDSTTVTVADDPRLDKSTEARTAQRRMVERLRTGSARLTEAVDKLSDADESLTKVSGQLRGAEGKSFDSLRRQTAALQDSVRRIRAFISGAPASDAQGISRSSAITVTNTIGQAQQYILSKSVAPGSQEEALVRNAEVMIDAAVARINTFLTGSFRSYRTTVEGTRIPLFKD